MEHGADIGLEFNEFSRDYTQDMIRCVPRYLDLLSSFTRYLPENFDPRNILDLGCGNGNVTSRLLAIYPDAEYHLVDASAEMISLCRKQFKRFNVTYANTYFKDFHFEDEKYDLIAAGFSLHHCENEEKRTLFQKIYNSLTPEGWFLYSDLMIDKSSADHPKLLREWGEYVNSNFPDGEKWTWVMEHYEKFDRPTDIQEQQQWLRQTGFQNIRIPFRDGYWIFLQAQK